MTEKNPASSVVTKIRALQAAIVGSSQLSAIVAGEKNLSQLCEEIISDLLLDHDESGPQKNLAALEKTRLDKLSHDLRSPLNAILGFAQAMTYDPAPKTELQKDGIAQITESGWQLLDLINTLSPPR